MTKITKKSPRRSWTTNQMGNPGLNGKSRLTQTPLHVPMKTSLSTTACRLLRLAFLAFTISLFVLSTAGAGLTMTIF